MRFLDIQHSAMQGFLIFWVKKVPKWFKKSETKAIQDDR